MIFFFIACFIIYAKSAYSPYYLSDIQVFLLENKWYAYFLSFGFLGIGILNLQSQLDWSSALFYALLVISLVFTLLHMFLPLGRFFLFLLLGIYLCLTLFFSL